MILDGAFCFDSASTISSSTTSANVVDIGPGARDIGEGGPPLALLVQTGAAFASSGSPTLTVQFQGAPDNGSGSPGTYTTYAESGALALASLPADARIWNANVPGVLVRTLPPNGGTPLPRFLQLNYVVSGGTFTAGSITAILASAQDYSPNLYYANAANPQN